MFEVLPEGTGAGSSRSGIRQGQTLSGLEHNYAPHELCDAVLLTNFPVIVIAAILSLATNVRVEEVHSPRRFPP